MLLALALSRLSSAILVFATSGADGTSLIFIRLQGYVASGEDSSNGLHIVGTDHCFLVLLYRHHRLSRVACCRHSVWDTPR